MEDTMKKMMKEELTKFHCSILLDEVKEKVRKLKAYGVDDAEIVAAMNEEELFPQLVVMEDDVQSDQALTATGLIDWFQDLKQKNAAFLQKMNERTAEQAGQQKGIVREKRLLAEAAYKNLVKLINAAAIMEMPEGLDWNSPIDRLNAEIDHYKDILARKGSSSSSDEDEKPETDGDSSDGGSDSGSEVTPVTPVTPETTETTE